MKAGQALEYWVRTVTVVCRMVVATEAACLVEMKENHRQARRSYSLTDVTRADATALSDGDVT